MRTHDPAETPANAVGCTALLGDGKRHDALGDRMKGYERGETSRKAMLLIPIMARVDGRAFHSFTRGMDRPYDQRFVDCMVQTAEALLVETNACMAYTQSDEITLAWHSTDPKSQVWFDGRLFKMTSQLAAQATLAFYQFTELLLPGYARRNPTFDARVWQVPNRTEGANVFLWREWDATKNSITMAAQAVFGHRELEGKNGSEKQEMLFLKGINWNDYPATFKRGTYLQRHAVTRKFTVDEIEKLPPKHTARTNPDLMVERSEIRVLKMPPFGKVINREAVIFDGATPELEQVTCRQR